MSSDRKLLEPIFGCQWADVYIRDPAVLEGVLRDLGLSLHNQLS